MENDIERQKEIILGSVLDLVKEYSVLRYLRQLHENRDEPANKITINVFNDLYAFIARILRDNLVIKLSWLFDKNGQRSLRWYLKTISQPSPNLASKVAAKLSEIDQLDDSVNKLKMIRDKWIAHKDKWTFEKPDEFMVEASKLGEEEIRSMVKIAHESISIENPAIMDTTSTGVEKLAKLTDLIYRQNSAFLSEMAKWGIIDYHMLSQLDVMAARSSCK